MLSLLSRGALARPWAGGSFHNLFFFSRFFFMGDLGAGANSATIVLLPEGAREREREGIFFWPTRRLLSGGALARPPACSGCAGARS